MRSRQPPKALCNMQNDLDRLSELPGIVTDKILSSMSIRDAARTSILSNDWRYKWATLPNLVFDKDCCPAPPDDHAVAKSKLVNIIDNVFVLHFGVIKKFKLSHKDLQAINDIDRWILHVSRSSVEEFILEIWKGQRYRIPSSLYFCKDLTHLELFNCLLSPPPVFKGFQNLKTLDLQHITMTEDAFKNLVAWCPLLERLTLMNFDGFFNLKIHAPNLQFFDIGGDFGLLTFENTSLLSIVSIGLYINVGNELHGRRLNSTSNMLKFFASLPRLQRLEVQSYFLKYLALGNVPSTLPVPCLALDSLSLRINYNDIKENKAAFCLFKSSPNLSELEMLARPEDETIGRTRSTFWEDKIHVKCVFKKLRVVRIIDLYGAKAELDCVKFLLANSPVLEKMTVKPATADGGLELVKELLRYRRASVQAEVIYMDDLL